MSIDQIHIKGARANNLQDIDITIPKNKLVVVTGLSGSGKSSLIMDTLFAEGQRRYVESLSSYARQFLSRMKKPDVDFIEGICPAIAIEQRVTSGSARSTVGSMTEIYDFLRLLYARIGKTYSPISGKLVTRHSVSDVVEAILDHEEGTKILLTAPMTRKYHERSLKEELNFLLQKGFTRIYYRKKIHDIQDYLEGGSRNLNKPLSEIKNYEVLIDRFVVRHGEETLKKRMTDSVQTAFEQGEGDCVLHVVDGDKSHFNNRFELDGIQFVDPSPQLFNYNNPVGACPRCEGYGRILGIDPEKVIPNPALSIYEDAIVPWRSEKGRPWVNQIINTAHEYDFPVHKPYRELTKDQKKILWEGNEYFDGINSYFDELRQELYKIQNRILLSRYRGRTICPVCDGGRLNEQALCVRVADKTIADLIDIPITTLLDEMKSIKLSRYDEAVAKRILLEVKNRLETMIEVGLGYLTLDRLSKTLSGGETQRIHLTRTLGSNLSDSLYILDEPSIGLHPKDTDRLVSVLKNLRDLNNSVIVVEHEEAVIRNADFIIDIGPGAGIHGGKVCYSGKYKTFLKSKKNLTAQYLTGSKAIPLPSSRRKQVDFIELHKAGKNNLKAIDVKIPLHNFSVVTGVSGSGKSTLVRDILYQKLKQATELESTLGLDDFSGAWDRIDEVEYIGQRAMGKSSRSNPVTYVNAFDAIRKIMADMPLSRIQGYKARHFSFNVDGGRCEACQGEGSTTVEMQFLADVKLQCDECNGRRYKDEVLQVKYQGKAIDEILNLSVEEALTFFEKEKDIVRKLQPLADVGLGYLSLGQSSSTLSGGEAQRLKLASYLGKDRSEKHIFFIFDEPTTGLHFHDIEKLLTAFDALVENGHTLLVVEHNLDVIKCADWTIDLGPVGGEEGGYLLYQGPPEGLPDCKKSFTGQFLKEKL